jgi:nucleoside 2-deoxyribosyltransferase
MKITICGSIAFFEQMLAVQKELEKNGHEVKLPPLKIKDENGNLISVTEYYNLRKMETDDQSWIWQRKKEAIKTHFDKIDWSDAILVLNYDKKGIANYIGGNTLMEMGVAFYLNKPIYLYQPLPEVSYKEEILGMFPIIINGDLTKI